MDILIRVVLMKLNEFHFIRNERFLKNLEGKIIVFEEGFGSIKRGVKYKLILDAEINYIVKFSYAARIILVTVSTKNWRFINFHTLLNKSFKIVES